MRSARRRYFLPDPSCVDFTRMGHLPGRGSPFTFRFGIFLVLIAAIAVAAIGGLFGHFWRSSSSTPTDSVATNQTGLGVGDVAGGANTMRFETFTLQDDPSCIGGEVSRMLIPVGWKTKGGMAYDFSCFYPAQFNLRIYDPNSLACFATYPSNYYVWGNFPGFPPGSNYGGSIVAQPMQDPFEAIKQIVIPKYRPELADAKVVETELLP